MTTLNLYDMDKSDIKFRLNRFPDGEVQVTDLEIDKLVEGMRIIAPIRNAEELFVFSQLMYLIHERMHHVNVVIPYLMGARNDRKMEEGRSVNLFNVLDRIGHELFPQDSLTFITVHNENAVEIWFEGEYNIEFLSPYPEFKTNSEEMVIFPDAGAEKRFGHLVTGPYLVAEKSRDINQEQSQILTYQLLNPENYDLTKLKKIMIIDDLVDGGRTFRLLASELDSMLGDIEVNKEIYLTHFIQEEGLLALTEYYNDIYVCDTFRPLPVHEHIHKLKDIEEILLRV